MAYTLLEVKLPPKPVATSTSPLIVPVGAMSGNDATTLQIGFVVSAVSVGFTGAVGNLEQSADNGVTWTTVPGLAGNGLSFTATGTYVISLTATSEILLPLVRLTVTPNSGEEVLVTKVNRTFSGDETIIPQRPVSIVGVAQEATQIQILESATGIESTTTQILSAVTGTDFATETTLGAVLTAVTGTDFATETTLISVLSAVTGTDFATQTTLESVLTAVTGTDFATETTLGAVLTAVTGTDFATETTLDAVRTSVTGIAADVTKLKKWPYATHDTILSSWASGTFTDTYTYKTGGATGTTVGTITTVYADAARGLPSTTTYAPAKAV